MNHKSRHVELPHVKSKMLPPVYFWASVAAAFVLHFALPLYEIILSPWRWSGALFVVFGFIINIWTDKLFKRDDTTVKPYEEPCKLVADGPFRLSRNPMYVGMTSVLLGLAIMFGTLTPFICPIFFAIAMQLIFVPCEEANMQRQFGS